MIYCHSPLFGTLLDRLVPDPVIQTRNCPTTAALSVLRQPDRGGRMVVHVIHAVPQRRGREIDIVEDVLPLHDVEVGVRQERPVIRAYLAPGGEALPRETRNGATWVTVPRVEGHQLVVFE